jgi:multiple sugar transport system substrate-binding protein
MPEGARELSLIGPDDPALGVLKARLEARPGRPARLVIVPWPEYRDRLMAALVAPLAPHQAVFIPGHVWLPELAEAGLLADLAEIAASAPVPPGSAGAAGPGGGSPPPLLEGVVASVAAECRYRGKTWLVPFFTDGHILFYRPDRVGDLAARNPAASAPGAPPETGMPRPPVPVVSPLELEALAAAAHAAPEVYGIALKAHPAEIFLDWLPFLWAAGGDVLDGDGRPAFTGEAGVLALEAYRRLRAYAPPDTHAFGNAEIAQVIRTGRAALVTTWGGQAGPLFSGRRAGYAAAVYPRPWNAAWGIAIPANQPRARQAQALELLREVCDALADAAIIEAAGSPVLRASYSPQALIKYPWLAAQLAMLERCGTLPLSPQVGKFLGALYEAVYAAFIGESTPEEALRQAEQKVLRAING